jgi:hypothetical protein
MDTKKKDDETVTEETVKTDDAKDTRPKAKEVPMIVHHETYMDGAVQRTRDHGPMPVSEWADYEKEHGL